MLTANVTCPECGYGKAVYTLVPDEKQTKMIAKMLCNNVMGKTIKCGNRWDLDKEEEISGYRINVKQQ